MLILPSPSISIKVDTCSGVFQYKLQIKRHYQHCMNCILYTTDMDMPNIITQNAMNRYHYIDRRLGITCHINTQAIKFVQDYIAKSKELNFLIHQWIAYIFCKGMIKYQASNMVRLQGIHINYKWRPHIFMGYAHTIQIHRIFMPQYFSQNSQNGRR